MSSFININDLINLLAVAINLGLSIFILFKNRKSETNRSLGFLILFVALWILCSILMFQVNSREWILFWRRLSTLSSAMIVAFFLYLSMVFPETKRKISLVNKLLLFIPAYAIAALSIFTPLMIKDFVAVNNGAMHALFGKAVYGPLYRLATIYYITYVFLSLYNLITKFFNAHGRAKLQVFYVLFGIGSAGLTAITTSLILPLIGLPQYSALGPPATLIMAGFITYAIATHRLLNIEDFLSRGILYLSLAIGIVGTLAIIQIGRVSFILSFYIALFNFALAAFVFFQNKKNPINISFGAAILIAAIWIFSIGVFLESRTLEQLFLWSRIFYCIGALIPSILLYFSTIFPTEWPILNKFQKALIFFPSALVFIVALLTNSIVQDFRITAGGIDAFLGPFYPYYCFYLSVFMGTAFLNLFYKYGRATPADKMRVRYVLWGLFIVGFFAVIFNLILPWLGNYNLLWVGTYSAIFLTALTSYAIVKHHLMDMSLVISRTIAEILAVSFFGITFVLLLWTYSMYVSSKIDLFFLLLALSLSVLFIYLHQRIRLFFQTSADKLFLRGKYDYYRVLTNASAKVAEKLTLPSILEILYETFYDAVEVSKPRIFLPEHFTDTEKESKRYVIYDKQTYHPQAKGEEIKLDDPLIKRLLTERVPILNQNDVNKTLIVPCLLEERLIAISILGPKLSEDPYSYEDIRLLQILANQAATALDHARSYEKIKSDLEVVEVQLERSQRLASIGTLTAGVTHEIRNPLTVIRAETERLPLKPRDTEYLKDYKDLVLRNITRIEGIIQRMLGLARNKSKQKIEININEQIENVISLIPMQTIRLKKILAPIPNITGDPEALQEVFINIIQNAVQAMPHGGEITIKTFPENSGSVIEISDTGKGIPHEIQERIFDPFFSTRHEGTGLGLSIVYRIIREHGGDIRVRSGIGKGTTFRITF